jgi:large subunit ribosomal protein L10
MNRDQKAAMVEEMSSALTDAEAIFAVDYRGISVPQAAELRSRLAEADATFRIVKNRLAKRAAESAGRKELEELFDGPIALTLVKGDPVTAAKAIATFRREHRLLEFKGGLMEGAPLDPEQFMTIARLPALDVLHGQLVGLAASPITGLARGLNSMLSGLAVALGEIQEKGLVSGEAEPEPEAEGEDAEAEDQAEDDESPAEPDARASEEQGQSDESERAEAEDSAGSDSEDAAGNGSDAEGETDPAEPDATAEDSAGNDSDDEGQADPATPGREAEDVAGTDAEQEA